MTVRVRPLNACDKPGCGRNAQHRITFETHRGEIDGPKVCEQHITWGRGRALEMERS